MADVAARGGARVSAERRGLTPGQARILMTADAVGGVWGYATDLAAGLRDSGHEVTLAVVGPSPRREQIVPSGVAMIDTGLPLDWLAENEDAILAAGSVLSQVAGDCRATLIHLNSPALAAGGGLRAPVVGVCHSCLATWWDAVHEEDLPPHLAWRRDILARGYTACDRLIAPSRSFADATAARFHVSPIVVPNGRSSLACMGGAKDAFVLTAGRLWDAGKNVQTLDRAANLMRGAVYAAGAPHGPDGASVALDAVESLGVLDPAAMQAALCQAAVFVSLALYEPFGLAVLEAAQAGCALVLSDITTFRELWSDAAVFVPAHDAASVAAVLDGLLDDPVEASRLGALARARAAQFTPEAMVAGTLAVYGLDRLT